MSASIVTVSGALGVNREECPDRREALRGRHRTTRMDACPARLHGMTATWLPPIRLGTLSERRLVRRGIARPTISDVHERVPGAFDLFARRARRGTVCVAKKSIRTSCCEVVFVDESAEAVSPEDACWSAASRRRSCRRDRRGGLIHDYALAA